MFVVNGRFLTQKPTGVHRYALEICNKLYELGVDFHVAIPKQINPDYDVKFKTVECGNLKTHLWEQINLPAYLKRIGSPLLISFSGCGPLNYNNQIITIHDVSHEVHPEWFSKNYCRYYHFMLPRIARKALAVITVSQFSKQEIIDVFQLDANKIKVIPCDVPFHNKPSKEDLILKEKVSEKYILTVSSMDPRKNFVRLVEAFNNINDKSVKLYIIGMKFKAFNTPDLQKLVGDNVVLPGYVNDKELQTMYSNALFSIYPSLYEGFGLPPLESMTFGCPVIASDIPAIREVNENAVLYVNPLDVSDMTQKMNQMINDANLRADFQARGFEQIKKYSWDITAEKVLELIAKHS